MTQTDAPPPDDVVLTMRGVEKVFPGVRALHGVDFTLRRGEVHALMGENGAGKSTLIKVLTGVHARDGGEFHLDGKLIHPQSPLDAQHVGISTVYQEVNLVPALSVAENVFLGREPTVAGKIKWGEVKRRAHNALARLDVHIDVTQPLGSYPIAIQQLVAIARATDIDAQVLILDEPTSSLSVSEVERLFRVMRKLKEGGLGIVFVTHFLDQVYAITDRITILRNGTLVGEYATKDLPRLELIAKMIGKDLDTVAEMTAAHGAAETGVEHTPLLVADNLERSGMLHGVDVTINRGQVLGLAGLLGSGRTETARLLFGLDKRDGGKVSFNGQSVNLASPREAMKLGIGFAPEDRKTEAILPDLSVRENIIIALQAQRGWLKKLPRSEQKKLADHYIKALNIRTPDGEKPIAQLSGGNQQKAILARWLASKPQVLIVDEPTRGIDVGAKAEIETLLSNLCKDGLGILFISSEMDETVRNCHRVIVLRDGKPVGELAGEQIGTDSIMRAIAGDATGSAA